MWNRSELVEPILEVTNNGDAAEEIEVEPDNTLMTHHGGKKRELRGVPLALTSQHLVYVTTKTKRPCQILRSTCSSVPNT